jgi:hypothetical protein
MEICVVVWHKRRRGFNLVVVRVLSSHVLSLTVCCLKIPSILVAVHLFLVYTIVAGGAELHILVTLLTG